MPEIYLIRHSEAVELDNEIVEEGYRYLTTKGRRKAFEVTKVLNDLNVHFDLIISSPLVRAVQTAEIIASGIIKKPELKTAIELIGGNTFERFHQMLRRHSHYREIACVGHAPDVNNFALKMIKHDEINQLKINFKNCSVCKIDYDIETTNGNFVWFLKSDTMELIQAQK